MYVMWAIHSGDLSEHERFRPTTAHDHSDMAHNDRDAVCLFVTLFI